MTARFASGRTCRALSRLLGEKAASWPARLREPRSRDSASAKARAAAFSSAAWMAMSRSASPAASNSGSNIPEDFNIALFSAVAMTTAASETPGRPESSRAACIKVTESKYAPGLTVPLTTMKMPP